jgi:NifU-like protein involved in Fe-S cluster formation
MEPIFLHEGCDVFMNESEIILEEIIKGERFKEIPSLQSNNDDIMQLILKILHDQRLKWRPHGKKIATWAFLCVVDNSLVDVKVPHVMCCML